MIASLRNIETMKRIIGPTLVAILLSVTSLAAQAEDAPETRQILGWLEFGIIQPGGAKVDVKLDTGAKTSSMHALDIEIIEKKGKKYVRFRFDTGYDDDEDERYDLTLERPLVREVVIKRHKKNNQVRPVVMMEICLGGQMYEGEFSLVDRTRFNYPVLLGRRLLAKSVIVDPASTFTKQPNCSSSDS